MNKNIRIARQLLKIAKSLCAGYSYGQPQKHWFTLKASIISANVEVYGEGKIDEEALEKSIKEKINVPKEMEIEFALPINNFNNDTMYEKLFGYHTNLDNSPDSTTFIKMFGERVKSFLESCLSYKIISGEVPSSRENILPGKKLNFTFYTGIDNPWDIDESLEEIHINLNCEIDFGKTENKNTLNNMNGSDNSIEQRKLQEEADERYRERYEELGDTGNYLLDDE